MPLLWGRQKPQIFAAGRAELSAPYERGLRILTGLARSFGNREVSA